MSNFDLPLISSEASPEFSDAGACAQWLKSLPLINIAPAHGMLLGQLEELNCFELAPAERLKILEVLREPVFFVQTEHAKKFSGRALPLSKAEREIFNNVTALWDALGYGYQHCLQAIADGDKLSGQAALACERALDSLAQKMVEHYKSYQEIAPEDWQLLHKLYRFAEERGFDDSEVSDPFCKGSTNTTCGQTWVRTLLLNLANPNEQTPRQIGMVTRWLERWAAKASIGTDPKEATPLQLAVDLDGMGGASREPLTGEAVRYLGMDEVGHSLKKRITLLRKGESPASLKLGDDCVQPSCEQLLLQLYRHWCDGQNVRAQSRKHVSIAAQAAAGMPSIHHHVGGRMFQQPKEGRKLTQKESEEIATFGRISTREADDNSTEGVVLENWHISDESLGGLRLTRRADEPGARVAQNQLIGVRPADGKSFILCTVCWLRSSQNFDLNIGVRIIPGVPQPVAVRATGVNATTEQYVPALALPAVPALGSPASLLLPIGWFKPKRVIDVAREKTEPVLLTGIIERGPDFERVSFEPA